MGRLSLTPLLLLLSSQLHTVASFTANHALSHCKLNVTYKKGNEVFRFHQQSDKPNSHAFSSCGAKTHTSSLLSSSNPNESEANGILSNVSLPYLITWLSLIAWTVILAPGEMTSDSDMEMAISMISSPTSSGVNPLYYTIFNYLGIMPLILASLIMPGAKYSKVSPTPFLFVSAAFGFGAIGPYMTLRGKDVSSTTTITKSDLGWFTRTFLENKIFNSVILLMALSIPYFGGLYTLDIPAVWDGFQAMFATSKLVSVSTVDLSVLTVTSALLIREDLMRRGVTDGKANLIAAKTVLLPVLGAGLYCIFRPELEE